MALLGRVVPPAGAGWTVKGARVAIAYRYGEPLPGVPEAVCDAEGRFRFERLPQGFALVLVARPPADATDFLQAMPLTRAIVTLARDYDVTIDAATTLVTAGLHDFGRGKPGPFYFEKVAFDAIVARFEETAGGIALPAPAPSDETGLTPCAEAFMKVLDATTDGGRRASALGQGLAELLAGPQAPAVEVLADSYQFVDPQPSNGFRVETLMRGSAPIGFVVASPQPSPGAPILAFAPTGLTIDRKGELRMADALHHVIWTLAPGATASDWNRWQPVGVFAFGEGGRPGYQDGLVNQARFDRPLGLATGPDGTIYVADADNHVIRAIDHASRVSTYAGTPGQRGWSDGPGNAARFDTPTFLAVDSHSTVFVADAGNHSIRRIAPDRSVMTLAGQPDGGRGDYVDGPAERARFDRPAGLAFDGQGDLYIADLGNHVIRRIRADGMVGTHAGTFVRNSGGVPRGGLKDGPAASARFASPEGLAFDAAGNLLVADRDNHRVRRVSTAGQVETIAGCGFGVSYRGAHRDGAALSARFDAPFALAVGPKGEVYVSEDLNRAVRVIRR